MGPSGRMAAVIGLLTLAGCGTLSSVGSLFGFGNERDSPRSAEEAAPQIPLIDQVLSLSVDPTPGGVIVSAVGLPPTQGFWQAELIQVASSDPTVLVLDFAIEPPLTPAPVGTQPSREVLAGAFLGNQDLRGIRSIAVQGRLNRRSVTRQ